MGNHRAATVEARRDLSTPPPADPPTPYVGRRIARPTDATPAPRPAAPAQPYVGRRIARPATTPTPAAVETTSSPLIDTGVIERVLADLEPVDHTTSFVSDQTEILPLLPATPVAAPRTQTGGRRRAPRRVAHPLARRLPSIPVLAGVAALAISVGGVVTTAHTDLASSSPTLGQVGALTGTSGSGSIGARDVVSRSGSRDDSSSLANQVATRNEKLASVDKQAAAHSEELIKNRWVVPVDRAYYHLTARFGDYGLWSNLHTGLDFAANPGTPIHAIATGVVTSASYDGAYGNKTVVTLPDGTEIWYCHQTSFLVSVGDQVTVGETIGTVGSTGHVTGPHVHIEVRPGGGDPVDPYAAMVAHGVTP